MNIKIAGKGKNTLRLKFEDGNYAIVNLLKESAWEITDGKVDKASYSKGHPYLGEFELLVESNDDDPVDILLKSAEKIEQDAEEMADKLKEAI